MPWFCLFHCSSFGKVFFFNVIFSIFRGFVLQFQISTLFDGHPDLVDEFTTFLPEEASVSAKNLVL